MSRFYLDTNFLYAHLRAPRGSASEEVEAWRARVLGERSTEGSVISALVLDELAYRLILTWLRDDGKGDPLGAYREDPRSAMRSARSRLSATWSAIDSLTLELQPTDHTVVERAQSLMAQPGLTPRDAFHAAHALAAGCGVIASSDASFDRVPGLKRLGP